MTIIWDVGDGRMAKPAAKLPGEMGIVTKAAGVCDLADQPARTEQCPSMQLTCSIVQAYRLEKLRAGRPARQYALGGSDYLR